MEARAPGSQRRVLSRGGRGSDLSESQAQERLVCSSIRKPCLSRDVFLGWVQGGVSREGYCSVVADSMCKCPGIGLHGMARELWHRGEAAGADGLGRRDQFPREPQGFWCVVSRHVGS